MVLQGLYRDFNMEILQKEVQHICIGTLYCFIPEPSQNYVQADQIILLIRFNNVVRWKYSMRN